MVHVCVLMYVYDIATYIATYVAITQAVQLRIYACIQQYDILVLNECHII